MTRSGFLILCRAKISNIQRLIALCRINLEAFSDFNPNFITLWIILCRNSILFRNSFCHTTFLFIRFIITVFGLFFVFNNGTIIYWWLIVWVCVKWLSIRGIRFTSQCRILSKFLFAHVLVFFCLFFSFFIESFDSYLN